MEEYQGNLGLGDRSSGTERGATSFKHILEGLPQVFDSDVDPDAGHPAAAERERGGLRELEHGLKDDPQLHEQPATAQRSGRLQAQLGHPHSAPQKFTRF